MTWRTSPETSGNLKPVEQPPGPQPEPQKRFGDPEGESMKAAAILRKNAHGLRYQESGSSALPWGAW